jgi:hypothetical protein
MTLAASSGGGGAFAGLFLIGLIFYVITIIAQWKIFTKAGQRGWTCLIPILNIIVLLRIVKRPLWWVVFAIIPFIGWIIWFILLIIVLIDLAKAFGHGAGYALGLIFLPFIFMLMLGYGSSTYQLEPDPLF